MPAKTPVTPEGNPNFRRLESHDQPRASGKSSVRTWGREALVGSAAIVLTSDNIAEVDELSPFLTEHIQEFVEFVGAGLPEVFLRTHPDLLDADTQEQISEAIAGISDRSLQRYLRSRLMSIREYSQMHEAAIARSSDKKKTAGNTSKS